MRNVDGILTEGFRDAEGTYLTATVHRGVWLADRSLDWNDAGFDASDLSIIEVEIPEEAVTPYEWVEEGRSHREFLVPAEIVNRYPRNLTFS